MTRPKLEIDLNNNFVLGIDFKGFELSLDIFFNDISVDKILDLKVEYYIDHIFIKLDGIGYVKLSKDSFFEQVSRLEFDMCVLKTLKMDFTTYPHNQVYEFLFEKGFE